MEKKIKITVVGSGYVGMSLAALLSQYNEVTVLDIDQNRINQINKYEATIKDPEINEVLSSGTLKLHGTTNKGIAYKNADFVIVATPTNYDPDINFFDTSSVDQVVKDALAMNSNALIVVKSTLPIGHINKLQRKFDTSRIIFSPEFLREGNAIKDNLYPSRIIIGGKCVKAKKFAELLKQVSIKDDVKILFISSEEAEAVKLFSNTYLAMRVSFFNELDSYALKKKLSSKNIINGVCLDERISDGYNNPSFGYGGYCLPKDTKQLLASFEDIPQSLIQGIVSSNKSRKDFLTYEIMKSKPRIVGFFRLIMKSDSDNFRSSAIQGIINRVKAEGIETIIFEPSLEEDFFHESKIVNNLNKFKSLSDIIVVNRLSDELNDVHEKCFTRDIFQSN